MKITFRGAVGTVTGSRFLVEGGGARVLVDCGMFQGVKLLRERNWLPSPVDPASLDAVVLTHAHVDHSGMLPALVRDGFRGPIWCTAATDALCRIILPDSGHLQEEAARYAGKRGFSRHERPLPLYTEDDARGCLRQLQPAPWSDPATTIRGAGGGEGLTIGFHRAGHILGAASVRLVDASSGKSVLFSGDLGRPDDLLMWPPAPPADADVIVIESTYGDRVHAEADPIVALAEIAKRTHARGGVLLIPAFAVGRSQLLMHALQQGFDRGLAPRMPMYLNSPMATDVTDLYLSHAEDHRLSEPEIRALCRDTRFVQTAEDSKRLNEQSGPMAIISASGMLSGGRVLHHIKAFGADPRNTILLAGFQAPGTRGGALAAGKREIKIHGSYVDIQAEVASLDIFSAHADRDELLAWLGSAPRPPSQVFAVHGEHVAADALRVSIRETHGFPARVPPEGEPIPV